MLCRFMRLGAVWLLVWAGPGLAQQSAGRELLRAGDAERGRLAFGPCRTCHYPEAFMGHNNGPNLHRIFGKVAGKQAGFAYYSEPFKAARFVWTPQLMYAWLENPMAMFPGSSMMSLGVPDPQRRADLIAFLEQASVREP
jgi:cytochrome c